MTAPRILSLGAGVQSTTVLLLAAEGRVPTFDLAVFADTGWEPAEVYATLDRLEREVAEPAGIPLVRVERGNLRNDHLNGDATFTSMPLFVRGQDGREALGRRQCTNEYKLVPIQRKVREVLGAPPREDGVPGRVPAGRVAEVAIGISLDEVHRARDSRVGYQRFVFPLLDLGWTRKDCVRYLDRAGWGDTPKSACVGCPFHGNATWRDMRDNKPDQWADAVAFDEAIRKGPKGKRSQLKGEQYLHRSLLPLSVAPIDRRSSRDNRNAQVDALDLIADDEADAEVGCSPFSCRSDGL